MRREEYLLILFSLINLEPGRMAKALELLKSRLDWGHLLLMSRQQGVSCLFYYHLHRLGLAGYVPASIFEELRSAYYINSARNTLIYEELDRLLDIFEQNQIKVILLKGLDLAESVYKNIALRPMSDMDILIKKDDFPKISKVLRDLAGYSAADDVTAAFNRKLAYSALFARIDHSLKFSVSIDLHWDILTSSWMRGMIADKINPANIWSKAYPARPGRSNCLALSCQHHLFHLCLHGFSHSFERIIMLTDILEFVRHHQDKIKWDEAREEAKLFGLEEILFYSIYYAGRRLDSEITLPANQRSIRGGNVRASSFYLVQERVSLYGLPCILYILLQSKICNFFKYALRGLPLLRKLLLTH